MLRFREWLLLVEGRTDLVPPGVLQGYEHAFRQELQKVIQRVENPSFRARLQEMLRCPIRDSRGRCRTFTDYILAALLRHGVQKRYDVEGCLSDVVEKMLMGQDEAGTVFGGFVEKPGETPDYNPLQVRFRKALAWAVSGIVSGRIPRLARTERRPPGTSPSAGAATPAATPSPPTRSPAAPRPTRAWPTWWTTSPRSSG
jgi:hypothetical protein